MCTKCQARAVIIVVVIIVYHISLNKSIVLLIELSALSELLHIQSVILSLSATAVIGTASMLQHVN